MKKLLILLIGIISISSNIHSQITFNKQTNFGYHAAILNNIIATDSCYYVAGMIQDTTLPFQIGIVFSKFDLQGNLVFSKPLVHKDTTYFTPVNVISPTTDSAGFLLPVKMRHNNISSILLLKYNSDGDIYWRKEYTGTNEEQIGSTTDIKIAENGNIILLNSINDDILITYIDNNYNIKWQESYGGYAYEVPYSLALHNNEILIGAGRFSTATNNFIYQIYIPHIDTLGNMTSYWATPYTQDTLYGGALDMIALEDGSLIIASTKGVEVPYHPYYSDAYMEKIIFKLSPTEQKLWEVRFRNLGDDFTYSSAPYAIIQLRDSSGFVATGFSNNSGTSYGWIGKVSTEGDSLWARNYAAVHDENTYNYLYDVQETSDGGLLLCGEYRVLNYEPFPQKAWLLKLDKYGCLVPGCHLTNTDDDQYTEDDPLKINVYPNPASDFLNLWYFNPKPSLPASLQITNEQGQSLFRQDDIQLLNNTTFIIPVSRWPAGNYFLQYLENGQTTLRKNFYIAH